MPFAPFWGTPIPQLQDFYSQMRSEGFRFTLGVWGWGCVDQKLLHVVNRSQACATSAWPPNRLRESRKAPHARMHLEWSRKYVQLTRDAPVKLAFSRRCLCDISVSPQLYWCLQRRCLDWSVSPQFYWCAHRRCLCEQSVSPQLYWRLQKRCLCEWSVAPQF